MGSFVERHAFQTLYFDQCAKPMYAKSQKTTDMRGTKRVFPLLVNRFGSLKCVHKRAADHERSLVTVDGDGREFNTDGSEIYTRGMCKLVALVAMDLLRIRRADSSSPLLRQPGVSNDLSEKRQLASMRMAPLTAPKFLKSAPMASLIPYSSIAWGNALHHVLTDNCSDAHIVTDKSCFISYVSPADVGSIAVGKDGEQVEFVGMGMAVMALVGVDSNGKEEALALVLDKAYHPAPGHSRMSIISLGRLFAQQGVEFYENGRDVLVIGNYEVRMSRRYYSPHVVALYPSEPARLELAAHISGGGTLTVRLGHLRLAHGGSKWVSTTLGLKGTTMRKCHCCALFRAITPSASSTQVVATRVGQRVSI